MFIWYVLVLFNSVLIAYIPQKITVMTKPIGFGTCVAHQAVLQSLQRGLQRCNVSFNINPALVEDVGDVVHVIAGDNSTIEQVIEFKRSGRIKKLLFGPNVWSFCSAGSPYVLREEVDAIISLADWVIEAFLATYPTLEPAKVKQWFSGVDEFYWLPVEPKNSSGKVLIYNKGQASLAYDVESLLSRLGFEPIAITYRSEETMRHYTYDYFRSLLQEVDFAVFLSYSESQGIALAEAWAMNVPTLVWSNGGPISYLGINYAYTSAAPFLTPATGFFWRTLNELESLLTNAQELLSVCSPRAWVLEHMTDTVSVQALLAIIADLPD